MDNDPKRTELKVNKQVQIYSDEKHNYESLAIFLSQILSLAAKKLRIMAMVSSRAKEVKSFAEKAIRKADKYPAPAYQFDDLCGARVIVNFASEIEPICKFIRQYFDIDEAGTEDVAQRLGLSSFGYRGIHFTVSLNENKIIKLFKDLNIDESKGDIKKPDPILYQTIIPETCKTYNISPGPRYRSEIQVRNLLQHAWAECAHDRVYKSEFKVPSSMIRDLNRISANLENADNEFVRIIHGIEKYYTDYGAYMTREEMQNERQKLELLRNHDPNNLSLHCKMALISKLLGDYESIERYLSEFIKKWEITVHGKKIIQKAQYVLNNKKQTELAPDESEPYLFIDPDMAKVLVLYGQALFFRGDRNGITYIQSAIALDPNYVEAWLILAKIFKDKALACYQNAYNITPSDPAAIGKFVLCRMIDERNISVVPLIRPSLLDAIEVCKDRIQAGVYIPQAYYDIGFFNLLLERPYDSLNAYAAAIIRSHTISDLEENIKDLDELKQALRSRASETFTSYLEWIDRFMNLVKPIKIYQLSKCSDNDDNSQQFKKDFQSMASPDIPQIDMKKLVVIVAGVCDKRYEEKIKAEYGYLLTTAFEGFTGAIFCGGTKSGISGLIGDLKIDSKKFAYFPETIPYWTEKDNAYHHIYTTGKGFSALEPLQNWIDFLATGIDPYHVRLLGINGGDISAFEFRLALTLGATVGIIRGSGRAAHDIFEDSDWNQMPNLISLPNDPQTIKIFVQGIAKPSMLLPEDIDKMAEESHKEFQKYRKSKFTKNDDPALLDWKELPLPYKKSSVQQIAHTEEKLRTIGCGIRKEKKPDDFLDIEFSDSEIERLAEMEHGRWNAERLIAGWRLGERDLGNKTSPYLISWPELADDIKEFDRLAVRNIPKSLKKYGYVIYRLADEKTSK